METSTMSADRAAEVFEEHRALLSSIAYRMLGSVADAEDAVQETYVRFERAASNEPIASPKAFLTSITTRLCIDQLRSARVRRETYVGPWLPEPIVTDDPTGPAELAEQAESLSLAFLVLLESLTPVERAVFLLREVFGYGYEEIAPIVGKSEDNCRQLALRARKQLEARRPRFEVSGERRRQLADRFFDAARRGDTRGLIELLAEDVVAYGDGGGKAPTFASPVFGREGVIRLLAGLTGLGRRLHLDFRPVEVNGQPGVMLLDPDGALVSVIAVDVAEDRVRALRSISNPDKLRHLGPVSDARRLFTGSPLPPGVVLGDEG